VPVFFLVDRAVEATNKYSQWKKVKEKNQEEETFKNNEARKNQAEELIQKAKKENQKSLNYETASQIAGLYGIEAAESKTISATDNDFSFSQFPVVAKVDSDKVFHKTDQGGLVLNIQNQKELEKAIEDLRKKFPEGNIIIQPMLAKGTELILGIKNDEIFGPIVVYGLGGIYTEVFRMVDLLVPNLSLEEILENIKKSRIKFLFEKTRGQNPHNIEEVGLILKGLLDFSQECQNVKEVDINPLIIYNNDQKGVAVDIKIVI